MKLFKRSVSVGDEVYLPKYKAFGEVREIMPDGTISKVAIQTPRGEMIVNTLNLVVRIAMILESLVPVLKRLWQSIFSKKKQEA